jgi:hypothetical protein
MMVLGMHFPQDKDSLISRIKYQEPTGIRQQW